MPFPRSAGILLHPTSLPGGHGIGDLGQGAYAFVDFLESAGLTLWQVLPLGPTVAANSPYQALSSFAGNPLLISLESLCDDKLLVLPDLAGTTWEEASVDFEQVSQFKDARLRKAYGGFRKTGGTLAEAFARFQQQEASWLEDFVLFVTLKKHYDGKPWFAWPQALIDRDKAALSEARQTHSEEMEYHAFCQFLFFRQWNALRAYGAKKKIRLMGDVPIYVAHDSADVWAAPELFRLDKKGRTTSVAGVPPDYFSATGQLWGNPIYRWDVLAEQGYSWWIERIRATLKLVDLLRIDHFRGFAQYWEVPAGEETAINGTWVDGPGAAFFEALRKALGELPILAEDLGVITDDVHALREGLGLPGMKILQFAFCEGAEAYLPHTYDPNCVVYTATHDNDTSCGWYAAEGPDYAHHDPEVNARERDKARRYLARDGRDIAMDLIRLAMASVADTAIFPMQDVLGLGNDARMNRPGIAEGQWTWRMTAKQLKAAPADGLREMVGLYGRGS